MPTTFRPYEPDQMLLLAPDVRDGNSCRQCTLRIFPLQPALLLDYPPVAHRLALARVRTHLRSVHRQLPEARQPHLARHPDRTHAKCRQDNRMAPMCQHTERISRLAWWYSVEVNVRSTGIGTGPTSNFTPSSLSWHCRSGAKNSRWWKTPSRISAGAARSARMWCSTNPE